MNSINLLRISFAFLTLGILGTGCDFSIKTSSTFHIIKDEANEPPTVSAGPDRNATVNQPIILEGTVSDDGLPNPPGAVSVHWAQVSGPAQSAIVNVNSLQPSITFSIIGTYVFSIIADDGDVPVSDSVEVTVSLQAPINRAPIVNAGPDKTSMPSQSISVQGTVTDDGLPIGAVISSQWSQVSGSPSALISNPNSLMTIITLPSNAGTYIFRLTASDSLLSSNDQMQIVVSAAPVNQAPIVNAGPDQSAIYNQVVVMQGSASDDGLPTGSTLSKMWSQMSGPANALIANPSSLSTNITMPAVAGNYVFKLMASDGVLSSNDQIQVNVSAMTQGPVSGIWISQAEVAALRRSGGGWNSVKSEAGQSLVGFTLGNQNDNRDSYMLAKALYYSALKNSTDPTERADANCKYVQLAEGLMNAIGTEHDDGGDSQGQRILAVSRNILAPTLAADLIDFAHYQAPASLPSGCSVQGRSISEPAFRDWLGRMRTETGWDNGPNTLIECFRRRPNNWGTHSGAALMAIALYRGEISGSGDLTYEALIPVAKGYLGDRSPSSYTGFQYSSPYTWQASASCRNNTNSNQTNPECFSINPSGSRIDGYDVDGALPEELRRSGGSPASLPACSADGVNYTWTALEGVSAMLHISERAASILHRPELGLKNVAVAAVDRAADFITNVVGCPAVGNDRPQVPLYNFYYYGSIHYPISCSSHQVTRSYSYTAFTHQNYCTE